MRGREERASLCRAGTKPKRAAADERAAAPFSCPLDFLGAGEKARAMRGVFIASVKSALAALAQTATVSSNHRCVVRAQNPSALRRPIVQRLLSVAHLTFLALKKKRARCAAFS